MIIARLWGFIMGHFEHIRVNHLRCGPVVWNAMGSGGFRAKRPAAVHSGNGNGK